ncbi:hypothetical protein ACS0TY_018026 [Phlomoides rotata]
MVEANQDMPIIAEDEDDDGPPPGFQCIIAPPSPQVEKAGAHDDDEEEDGPPPGFHSIAPEPTHSLPSSDMERISNQDNIDNDDEDGPPPGWEFNSLVDALPKATSTTTGIKEEVIEELDDGPPPGWESVLLPCQMPPPRTPPLPPLSTVSHNIVGTEIGSKQKATRNDNEVPPSETQCMLMPGQVSPATPPLQQQSSSELPYDAGNKDGNKKIGEEKNTSGHKPASQQLPPNPPRPSAATSSPSEKAQLVCGTCRGLCVYPRGAKWVRCPGCQEVNFVLEAHEVGQVKCGGCSVLLMYPHGAPAVQCSSCRFVTEIGTHNKRPPLSVQQSEGRAQRRHRRFNRVR